MLCGGLTGNEPISVSLLWTDYLPITSCSIDSNWLNLGIQRVIQSRPYLLLNHPGMHFLLSTLSCFESSLVRQSLVSYIYMGHSSPSLHDASLQHVPPVSLFIIHELHCLHYSLPLVLGKITTIHAVETLHAIHLMTVQNAWSLCMREKSQEIAPLTH